MNHARNSELAATELIVSVMEDCGEDRMKIITILAMNDDGTERRIYSNARSEPEMFGMVHMAQADWAIEAEEEEA